MNSKILVKMRMKMLNNTPVDSEKQNCTPQ